MSLAPRTPGRGVLDRMPDPNGLQFLLLPDKLCRFVNCLKRPDRLSHVLVFPDRRLGCADRSVHIQQLLHASFGPRSVFPHTASLPRYLGTCSLLWLYH